MAKSSINSKEPFNLPLLFDFFAFFLPPLTDFFPALVDFFPFFLILFFLPPLLLFAAAVFFPLVPLPDFCFFPLASDFFAFPPLLPAGVGTCSKITVVGFFFLFHKLLKFFLLSTVLSVFIERKLSLSQIEITQNTVCNTKPRLQSFSRLQILCKRIFS